MKLDKFSIIRGSLVIKKVIYNDPATIVFWADGTKTVVKCNKNDIFDEEKGLAMAIVKRIYGEHYYSGIIKKYTSNPRKTIACDGHASLTEAEDEKQKEIETPDDIKALEKRIGQSFADFGKKINDELAWLLSEQENSK